MQIMFVLYETFKYNGSTIMKFISCILLEACTNLIDLSHKWREYNFQLARRLVKHQTPDII